MLDFHNLKNKKVLVMGLGLHGGGVSVVKWLVKQGAKVTATDLKTKKDLLPSLAKLKAFKVKYVLGRHNVEDFKKADLIIQNPGVPADSKYLTIAKKAGVPIENEATLFFRLCPARILAVSGTKGKSSLVSLLFHVLKGKYKDTVMAGNIRDVLMLDVLPKIKKTTKVILELSSFQLEGLEHLKKSPHAAFFTNIMRDHLNRYGTMNKYIDAKLNLIRFQNKNDFAILNADNVYTRHFNKNTKAKIFWFSLKKKIKQGAYIENNWAIFTGGKKKEKIFSFDKIHLAADYQREQFLAAAIAGKLFGLSNKMIYKGLTSYKGLHDRLEFLGEIKGIKYFNDTAATMPDAAISALKALGNLKQKNIVLLAGGANKNLIFQEFCRLIPKYCKGVVLFKGNASDIISRKLGQKVKWKIVRSMKEAVGLAEKRAAKGDIILLSPGAASFGLFKHEFDRGEQFKKCVNFKK
ncbi:MAG: UDP-N-acetylmuramoyl-L-alanine--D-glutamate ligase [Patescibacteria group bacterium]